MIPLNSLEENDIFRIITVPNDVYITDIIKVLGVDVRLIKKNLYDFEIIGVGFSRYAIHSAFASKILVYKFY